MIYFNYIYYKLIMYIYIYIYIYMLYINGIIIEYQIIINGIIKEIIIESQNMINLLSNTSNQPSKFRTKLK